jgi:hypothetical protein
VSSVVLDNKTHEQLRLLSAAWSLDENDAIAELIRRLGGTYPGSDSSTREVPIHVVYKGHRVEAEFDRSRGSIVIKTGPLAGQAFVAPSPAARAVVGSIDPSVNPHRNGWQFWIVTSTERTLQSIR